MCAAQSNVVPQIKGSVISKLCNPNATQYATANAYASFFSIAPRRSSPSHDPTDISGSIHASGAKSGIHATMLATFHRSATSSASSPSSSPPSSGVNQPSRRRCR
ncbi:hypothetical protein BE221DRAFT_79316 [Ostreococcus tauri]|uniref:Uncharacterized protein n=1 Tax=Ostreococcus tauri TaxID=70448 RepID=A0A1Y5I9E8_OSTTA|nr:hypothetical protein BE221DRAFT_79316 [Ostreococcus tauri]